MYSKNIKWGLCVFFAIVNGCVLAADIDHLAGLSAAWLSHNGEPRFNELYDIYPDNVINFRDFNILSAAWGFSGTLYFVSDTTGSDSYPGSAHEPFKTIQKAATVMTPGDVCLIRAGTYRETVTPLRNGTATDPICYRACPGETPRISGAELLDGPWSVYSGSIYKTSVTEPFDQLFVDGQMNNEARWPNTGVNQLVTMNRALTDSGTDSTTLVDSDLPAGDWTGASVHIVPGAEWISFTSTISSYTPGANLTFGSTTWLDYGSYYTPEAGDPYWLFGALAGLDGAAEWCLKQVAPGNYDCYLWCQGDNSPALHTVEIKKHDHAFNLSNKSYIHIKGLRVFAAALLLDNATGCVIEDCHFKYVDHFSRTDGYSTSHTYTKHANRMSGSGNEWKACSIVYSAGNGILDYGQNNRVTNCIIHDVDYMATYAAAIFVHSNSTGSQYAHNTLYNSGRFVFYLNGSNFECSYNDLYAAGYLTKDCGIIYTWGTDGGGTIIAYNHVHDNYTAAYPAGIYIDNYCSNYTIHHNLVWNIPQTGIQLSCPIQNVYAYNNTIQASCNVAFSQWTPPGESSDQSTCKVINNLHKCAIGSFGSPPPDMHHNGDYAINPDGTLSPGSGAIDAGYIIPGITNGYTGPAPDIGCYEYGLPPWQAGADWTDIPW
ncbi:MAG: right-handed parallel beta-helix repeat-containing protein [Sedimentisphaerales bacterium]|nr:right-handed parallel beta-helix repeat-containing protein [Sedimentisphaerales bacterium]